MLFLGVWKGSILRGVFLGLGVCYFLLLFLGGRGSIPQVLEP